MLALPFLVDSPPAAGTIEPGGAGAHCVARAGAAVRHSLWFAASARLRSGRCGRSPPRPRVKQGRAFSAVGAGRVRQLLGVALAAGASADIARWCGKCRDSRPVAARSVAHLYFSPRGPCPPCTESGSSTEKLRLTSLRFALRRRKDKKNKQANSLQKLCRCVLAGPDHTFWRLRCLLASCSTALPIGSLCT